MSLPTGAKVVTGAFLVCGTVHLVKPEVFEPLMPRQLPAHREIIVASGVAELLCAAGLLNRRTRKVAGYASAALLAGVYPGNVQMAVDALRGDNTPLKAASLARLPLQWPMIRAALKAARTA